MGIGDSLKSAFKIEHLTISEKDNPSSKVACHYNPKEVAISKAANYAGSSSSGTASANGTQAQYTGPGRRTLTMNGLLFDGWESLPGAIGAALASVGIGDNPDVSVLVNRLFGWLDATRQSYDNHTPRPPLLEVHWGSADVFTGILKTMSATYTMFSHSGSPLRATVNLSLEEALVPPAGTNPTSGATRARATATVADGDSLHSIAYRRYGNPNLWRAIASANRIDDPLRVPPGITLLLPSLLEATRGDDA